MAENQENNQDQQQRGPADRGQHVPPAVPPAVPPTAPPAATPTNIDPGHRFVGGLPGEPSVRVELQGGSRVMVDGPAPADVTADPASALNAVIIRTPDHLTSAFPTFGCVPCVERSRAAQPARSRHVRGLRVRRWCAAHMTVGHSTSAKR